MKKFKKIISLMLMGIIVLGCMFSCSNNGVKDEKVDAKYCSFSYVKDSVEIDKSNENKVYAYYLDDGIKDEANYMLIEKKDISGQAVISELENEFNIEKIDFYTYTWDNKTAFGINNTYTDTNLILADIVELSENESLVILTVRARNVSNEKDGNITSAFAPIQNSITLK